ncbi:hypothetical protein LUZ63_000413 [Rhynchospora breviuscula]|uniref:Uncharacterized protein n=1 Tax=Rhynchospora breviuscula TaxID=2022672 RepID=A0A9Q0HW21_9POAL|nr:hypothetical protein LUZ63_000413 [Rhynchospora breviuscula]
MAKLSYVLVFALLTVASVEIMMSKASIETATRRCQTTLSQNGCDLSKCRRQCSQSYNNGYGECIEGKSQVYGCVCNYDCGR